MEDSLGLPTYSQLIYGMMNETPNSLVTTTKTIEKINDITSTDRSIKGDVRLSGNGARYKYSGKAWNRLCSISTCDKYIQSNGLNLCGTHFTERKKTVVTQSPPSSKYRSHTQRQEKRKRSNSSNHLMIRSEKQNEDEEEEYYPKSNRSKKAIIEHRNYEPLKEWYEKHITNPYPTSNEKKILAKKANMTSTQVGNWFSFERYKEKSNKTQATSLINRRVGDHDHEEMISLLPVVKSAPAECGWNDCNEEIDVSDEDNEFEMLSKAGSSHSKQELDLSPQKIVDMFGDRLSGHSTRTKVVNHDKVDTKVEQQQQMVISISNLNAEQISKIEQFLRQFKISRPISDIINETTTHLITDELDMQPLVCTLTKNVVRAITRHLNIVCYRWIIDCLRHGRIIDCEQYEICGDTLISSQHNGPRISRLNENNLLFPVNIFVKISSPGYMGMNADDLSELTWSNGATYVADKRFPRTASERLCVELTEDELINDRQAYKNSVEQGVHYLHTKWLIDSIVKYKVQPIWKYQCTPAFDC